MKVYNLLLAGLVITIAGCGSGSSDGGSSSSEALSSQNSSSSTYISSQSNVSSSSNGLSVSSSSYGESISSASEGAITSDSISSSSISGDDSASSEAAASHDENESIESDDGMSLSYGGTVFRIPDSVGIPNLFIDDARIHENYKIIRSDRAVTVSEAHPNVNQNTQREGRYLKIEDDIDGKDKQALIAFDKNTIVNTIESMGGIENLLRAELFVWVEKGSTEYLQLRALQSNFSETDVSWSTKPNESTFIDALGHVEHGNWIYFNIPISRIKSWIKEVRATVPALVLKSDTFRHSLFLSSDETSRQPALVIHYKDSVEAEVSVVDALGRDSDNQACEIDVTLDPAHPNNGDTVKIHAVARDNVAMDYIGLNKSASLKAFSLATGIQREISLDYEMVAQLPSTQFNIVGDDKSGLGASCFKFVEMPINYSAEATQIDVDVDFEIDEVIPEFYRLIKNDGQNITLTISANDPDGIEYVQVTISGVTHTFTPTDSPTTFTRVFAWQNQGHDATTFDYRIVVRDSANVTTMKDMQEPITIRDYDQLSLYNNAPTFHNPSKNTLKYDPYMNNIFRYGEIHVAGFTVVRSPTSLAWHRAAIRKIAKSGACYGMCATAIEFTNRSRLAPYQFDASAIIVDDLDSDNSLLLDYIFSKHGSQVSFEVSKEAIDYAANHRKDVGFIIDRLKGELEDNTQKYPILSIFDESLYNLDGHSVVPWMMHKMPDASWRVYIYDPNREGGPYLAQTSPSSLNFSDNINHFPYIRMDRGSDSWSYDIAYDEHGNPITWTGDMFVVSYSNSVGDFGQKNPIDEGDVDDIYLTDHDLPNVINIVDGLIGYTGVVIDKNDSVEINIKDEKGVAIRSTEKSKILPYLMTDVNPNATQIYFVPNDMNFSIEVNGLKNGVYNAYIFAKHGATVLENKKSTKGVSDKIEISPSLNEKGTYRFALTSGMKDSDFELTSKYDYAVLHNEAIVEASRQYKQSNFTLDSGVKLQVGLSNDSKELHVNSQQGSVSFDLEVEDTSLSDGLQHVLSTKSVTTKDSNEFLWSLEKDVK